MAKNSSTSIRHREVWERRMGRWMAARNPIAMNGIQRFTPLTRRFNVHSAPRRITVKIFNSSPCMYSPIMSITFKTVNHVLFVRSLLIRRRFTVYLNISNFTSTVHLFHRIHQWAWNMWKSYSLNKKTCTWHLYRLVFRVFVLLWWSVPRCSFRCFLLRWAVFLFRFFLSDLAALTPSLLLVNPKLILWRNQYSTVVSFSIVCSFSAWKSIVSFLFRFAKKYTYYLRRCCSLFQTSILMQEEEEERSYNHC